MYFTFYVIPFIYNSISFRLGLCFSLIVVCITIALMPFAHEDMSIVVIALLWLSPTITTNGLCALFISSLVFKKFTILSSILIVVTTVLGSLVSYWTTYRIGVAGTALAELLIHLIQILVILSVSSLIRKDRKLEILKWNIDSSIGPMQFRSSEHEPMETCDRWIRITLSTFRNTVNEQVITVPSAFYGQSRPFGVLSFLQLIVFNLVVPQMVRGASAISRLWHNDDFSKTIRVLSFQAFGCQCHRFFYDWKYTPWAV